MPEKWVEALEELGRRAKEWLEELGSTLNPEPELIPVPVRPGTGRRRRDSRKR
jgi:hypothetical protein